MKLKWDISCPTYIEFLPFIYDILDSSLQEDIGKGNQVCFFRALFWPGCCSGGSHLGPEIPQFWLGALLLKYRF